MQQVTGEDTASSYTRVCLSWTFREISSQKGWLEIGMVCPERWWNQCCWGYTEGGRHCQGLVDTVMFSHRLDSDLRGLFQSNSFCNSLIHFAGRKSLLKITMKASHKIRKPWPNLNLQNFLYTHIYTINLLKPHPYTIHKENIWFHTNQMDEFTTLPIACTILYQECWNQAPGLLDLGLMSYWVPEQSEILKEKLGGKKVVYTSFLLSMKKLIISLVTFPKGPNTNTANTKAYFHILT